MGKEGRQGGRGRGRGRGGRGGGGHNNNNGGGNNNNRGGLANRGKAGGGGRGGRGEGGRFGNRGRGGKSSHGGGSNNNNKALSGALEATLQLVFEKYPVFVNDTGMLRLSGLKNVDELKKVAGSIDFNNVNFCNALANVIARMFPGVSFIDLSSNHINNPNQILRSLRDKSLNKVIRGFSFGDNHIKDALSFGVLATYKNLHEIVCGGNPICQQNNAKQKIISRVPWIQMIDGEVVEQQPLMLPWPAPVQHSTGALEVLRFLQDLLFNLAESGPDNCMAAYHEQASFSLAIAGAAPYVGKNFNNAKNALQAFQALRRAQEHAEHDLKDQAAKNRIAIGRGAIADAMKKMLYKPKMMCKHGINPDAHVVPIQQGVPAPIQLVTIHGVITWAHPENPNMPVSNAFDRTLTLIPSNGSGPGPFIVANDMISLRPLEGDAETSQVLWFPNNQIYLKKFVNDQQAVANPEILSAIAEQVSDEGGLIAGKNEVNNAGGQILNEAWSMSGNDPKVAIMIARVCGRTGCPAAKAFDALKSCNMNLDEASTKCVQ